MSLTCRISKPGGADLHRRCPLQARYKARRCRCPPPVRHLHRRKIFTSSLAVGSLEGVATVFVAVGCAIRVPPDDSNSQPEVQQHRLAPQPSFADPALANQGSNSSAKKFMTPESFVGRSAPPSSKRSGGEANSYSENCALTVVDIF